jgi:hypothetical protein
MTKTISESIPAKKNEKKTSCSCLIMWLIRYKFSSISLKWVNKRNMVVTVVVFDRDFERITRNHQSGKIQRPQESIAWASREPILLHCQKLVHCSMSLNCLKQVPRSNYSHWGKQTLPDGGPEIIWNGVLFGKEVVASARVETFPDTDEFVS